MRAIGSKSVTSDGTNVIITVSNCAFRGLNRYGVVLFKLNTAIPTDAATLPILISSNGTRLPLKLVGGETATAAQLTGVGVYLIYFNECCGELQLLTYGVAAAAEAATTTTTNSSNKSKY
jgi:hypothetical protein